MSTHSTAEPTMYGKFPPDRTGICIDGGGCESDTGRSLGEGSEWAAEFTKVSGSREPCGTAAWLPPPGGRSAVASQTTLAILSGVSIPSELGIEATGLGLFAIISAFQSLPSAALRFMLEHGLATIDANGRPCVDTERWYPVEAFRATFAQIARETGPASLYGVGLHMLDHVNWPPGIKNITEAMYSLDLAYHLNHRKHGIPMADLTTGKVLEGIGHFRSRKALGVRRIVSVVDSIYPCEFDRGILTGVAIRFDARAEVVHDPTAPCRRAGGQDCTYIVSW
jgi:hypothetical protein